MKADLPIYTHVLGVPGQYESVALMLSHKMDFNCCANRDGFRKSSHICTITFTHTLSTALTIMYDHVHMYISGSLSHLSHCGRSRMWGHHPSAQITNPVLPLSLAKYFALVHIASINISKYTTKAYVRYCTTKPHVFAQWTTTNPGFWKPVRFFSN